IPLERLRRWAEVRELVSANAVGERVVLGSNRRGALVWLVVSSLLTVAGIAFNRASGLGYWWIVVLCGGCATYQVVRLMWRSTLELTDEGFTYKSLGRSWTRRWRDVAAFGVWRLQPGPFGA